MHVFLCLRILCEILCTPVVIGNDRKLDTLQVILRITWTNLVDHLLDGVVIAGSLGDQGLSLVAKVLNREVESTARVPLMKECPDIVLYCFLDFIQFQL